MRIPKTVTLVFVMAIILVSFVSGGLFASGPSDSADSVALQRPVRPEGQAGAPATVEGAATDRSGGPRPVQRNIDLNQILLSAGVIDVRTVGENLLEAQSLPQEGGYYLVHFRERPDKKTADRFVAAVSSEDTVGYVPPSTYICRLDSSRVASVDAIEGVDWIGLWKPEYKISPDIETGTTATLEPEDAESDYLAQPDDEFIVIFFRGEDPAAYRTQIEALGGSVRSYGGERMSIAIAASRLPAVADIRGVYWIEKEPRIVPHNDNDTWIVQSYQPGVRTVFANGYTGAGQIVAVADTGIDMDHLMFWDSSDGLPDHTFDATRRKVLAYYNWQQTGTLEGGEYIPGEGYFDPTNDVYDWDLNRGHGSHVAGTVAGEWPTGVTLPTWGVVGTAGYDYYEGNAYGAKLVFQDLSRPDSEYVYPPPDLDDTNPAGGSYPGSVGLFPQAMQDGAYIHTNSWGGGAFGAYDAYSRDVDEMMWENPDFLVVFSNGNEGEDDQPRTITPPATAKNCLSVGASETSGDGYSHDSEDVAYFSSWGPAGIEGRVKPDVCAPGYWTFSAGNDNTTDGSAPNDGLAGYGGTSQAAPTVAGASALVREYFMTGGYHPLAATGGFMPAGAFTPSAALMKAMIINSAEPMSGDDTGGTIPGYGQGWGRMLLDNALYFPGDTRSLLVDDNRVGLDSDGLDSKEYTVRVAAGEPLDVVVVYTDPPAEPGSILQMINWLYVEVVHPNGSDYWLSGHGNFANGESVLNPDTVYGDVVQKVRINDPDPGVYTIRVIAYDTEQVISGWNVQPYALAISGILQPMDLDERIYLPLVMRNSE
jgi:hypothetical protein